MRPMGASGERAAYATIGGMRRRWVRAFGGPALLAVVAVVGVGGWATAASSSNDPYFAEQWALTKINAPSAWSKSTGTGVRIGVIDTGIDLPHEDLAAKVVASTSCIGARGIPEACSGSAQDDQGHGTHVSGIAAAVTANNKGIAGVAPDAQLVVVKALGSNGSGALNDVNAGIKWAVNKGARVINLSLESDGSQVIVAPGQSLSDGVDYAYSHNAVVVIAAGNSTPSLFGAAGYANINAVIVGATGRNDEVAWYSSSLAGAKWGLVAPGGDARGPDGRASCAGALAADCVVSAGWFSGRVNQYADDEGTSMATPHVAGVLALIMAQTPALSAASAVQKLLGSADPVPCGDGCRGRVNAAAAVGAAVAAGPPAPSAPSANPRPLAPSASVVPGGVAPTSPVIPGLSPTPAPATPGPGVAPTLPPAGPSGGVPVAAAPPSSFAPTAAGRILPVRSRRAGLPVVALMAAVGGLALVGAEAAIVLRRTGGRP
ncbi:MAG: hypothetical protein NVS3B21_33340 [Acidimicrobiales bacterium]